MEEGFLSATCHGSTNIVPLQGIKKKMSQSLMGEEAQTPCLICVPTTEVPTTEKETQNFFLVAFCKDRNHVAMWKEQ